MNFKFLFTKVSFKLASHNLASITYCLQQNSSYIIYTLLTFKMSFSTFIDDKMPPRLEILAPPINNNIFVNLTK